MNHSNFTLSDILGETFSSETALSIIKSDPIAYQDFQNYEPNKFNFHLS